MGVPQILLMDDHNFVTRSQMVTPWWGFHGSMTNRCEEIEEVIPLRLGHPHFFGGMSARFFITVGQGFSMFFPPFPEILLAFTTRAQPPEDGKYVDLFLGRLRTSSLPFSSAPPRDSSLRSRKIAKTRGSDKNLPFFFGFWQEIHTFDGQNP